MHIHFADPPLVPRLEDFTSAPRPVKHVGYGYPEGLDPLFGFFDHFLKRP